MTNQNSQEKENKVELVLHEGKKEKITIVAKLVDGIYPLQPLQELA